MSFIDPAAEQNENVVLYDDLPFTPTSLFPTEPNTANVNTKSQTPTIKTNSQCSIIVPFSEP